MKTIITLIIAFFALSFTTTDESADSGENVTDVTNIEVEHPQAPISTQHMKNGYENTLVFEAAHDMSIDVCYINEQPGELIISVSDEVGNLVAGVVITPELLASYLQTITPAQFAA